jgi:D-methionine transport system ATP-binding protein
LITLRNLAKNYSGLHAVNSITLEIPSNKIYGIIGKSGAGKSTLVRLLSLLEKPDAGEIYFDDDRVDHLIGTPLLERRRKLGMIFQNFNLFSSRNVFDNIAYPLEITNQPKDKIKSRVHELLAMVGLLDKTASAISQLSGGQKQRVAIARALANYPEILFCDEATSALDPQTTASILQLIKDIQTQMNLTVVMITHQMEVVRDACDFVSVIDDGEIVESGTVKDIFSFPRTKITREFVGTLKPLMDEAIEDLPRYSIKYRLHFTGESTTKPILARLIREYMLDVNILSGSIYTVGNDHIGELIVEFVGQSENLDAAKQHLQEQNVRIEVVDA